MRIVMVVLALWAVLAAAAGAQSGLPLEVDVSYAGGNGGAVTVGGTTLPGTVVAVRGGSQVVDESGRFSLHSTLPVTLVAVRGRQIRRLSLTLPSGATRWLARLKIHADLTQMAAEVAGALTITNHPPASVVVEHVETGKSVRTSITRGQFALDLPLVPKVNTLDWTLRTGWLSWNAPSLTVTVQ